MLPAHIDGPDRSAQIYGVQSIPDPPDRSSFNQGGGGSRISDNICTHLDDPGLSAQINGQYWIPNPPFRSAFNGGGGGP
jgi:hypothetical protein